MPRNRFIPDLIILGASTRAAAHSALRGGLRPMCVDLFGDADLRSAVEVVTIDDYPAGLPAIVERLPECLWMYTGGLENHPRIVSRLAEARPIAGNGPGVLAWIRDPWWLSSQLGEADLPVLEIWPAGEISPSRDGRWLRKPIRGAGGRGICVWDATSPTLGEPHYFQRRVDGFSYSALFVARSDREETVSADILGVTRQLVGLADVFAPPFAWCGSVTPTGLPAITIDTMCRIGERLAANAGLRGLFGCDFIVEGNVPLLTEVNPRYTAAMELLDYQLQTSLVAQHIAACGLKLPPPVPGRGPGWGEKTTVDIAVAQSTSNRSRAPDRVLAKLVLFSDRDFIAADATHLLGEPCETRLPFVADLPNPGQRIPAGFPVCTLFAEEPTEEACLSRLLESACAFRLEYLREAEAS